VLLKNEKLGGKGAWPRSRNLLFNSGIPKYFQNGESCKLPKVVNEDDGNLRAGAPSWSSGRSYSRKGREKGSSGGLPPPPPPETKHFHTCQSILFNNVVKMLKISQPVTFFPHPPLYQPQASWGILVSSIAAIMFNHDRGNWQNSVNSVFYYCVYSIILL